MKRTLRSWRNISTLASRETSFECLFFSFLLFSVSRIPLLQLFLWRRFSPRPHAGTKKNLSFCPTWWYSRSLKNAKKERKKEGGGTLSLSSWLVGWLAGLRDEWKEGKRRNHAWTDTLFYFFLPLSNSCFLFFLEMKTNLPVNTLLFFNVLLCSLSTCNLSYGGKPSSQPEEFSRKKIARLLNFIAFILFTEAKKMHVNHILKAVTRVHVIFFCRNAWP